MASCEGRREDMIRVAVMGKGAGWNLAQKVGFYDCKAIDRWGHFSDAPLFTISPLG